MVSTFVIVVPAVVGHILLPISLLSRLWRAAGNDALTWLAARFFAAGYISFIYLAGAWSWFGGLCRHALPALLILIALTTHPGSSASTYPTRPMSLELAVEIVLGAAFAAMTALVLYGRKARAPAIDLVFPLRGGTFQVGQGGASRFVNYHFPNPSQRYALDVLRLNAIGIRAWGLYPRQPDRYAIWRTEVVSPCDGVVAAAVDRFTDLSPPDRDPENRAGNHLAIECEGATVYLAHLMRNSMTVRAGDRVRAGQLLGHVGNSGNTSEPHLHIHAEKGAYPGKFSGMPGIPIRFGGRFLVRNDRVDAPA